MNINNTLKQMIAEQSKKLDSLDQNNKFHLSSPAYNREFKTVGLILPRMTGKTNAIVEMSRPNDLIITHNASMRDYLQRLTNRTVDVVYATQFSSNCAQLFRGKKNQYSYVFLDEVFLMDRRNVDMNYHYVDADWFVALTTL